MNNLNAISILKYSAIKQLKQKFLNMNFLPVQWFASLLQKLQKPFRLPYLYPARYAPLRYTKFPAR